MTRAATAAVRKGGRGAASTSRGKADAVSPRSDYWRESEQPLTSLLFLLPLLLTYEVGTRFITAGALEGKEQQIIAFLLLRQLFAYCGAHGRYLPAFALVFILLAWHILRNDAWVIRLKTMAGMALESVVLAVPVLMIGVALARYFPLAATAESPTGDAVILAVGAGVYEELVFRLMLVTLLSLILRDAFRIPQFTSGLLIVVISGCLFSAYHYLSPYEVFTTRTFIFRALAGIYFGILFLTRGFGITAAAHAAYDVLIVGFAALRI